MATTYSFKIGDIDVKYSDSNTVKIADTEYLLSLLSLRYFKCHEGTGIDIIGQLLQNRQ